MQYFLCNFILIFDLFIDRKLHNYTNKDFLYIQDIVLIDFNRLSESIDVIGLLFSQIIDSFVLRKKLNEKLTNGSL